MADGPGLPDAVVMALLCSGRIRTVIRGRGKNRVNRSVLDLGRSNRVVTVRLFQALLLRDGGCTHPGCRSRAGLEAHHVRHWLFGGLTKPDNLVLLCRRHHHAHHAGQFSIGLGRPGEFRFLRADGRELEPVTDPARLADTSGPVENEHTDISPAAAAGNWSGERLDRQWTIAVLAQRRHPTTSIAPEPQRWRDRPDPDDRVT